MKLYVILDRELLKGKDPVEVAKELVDGGVDLIQYRDKISSLEEVKNTAEKLRGLDFPLIINDYPEIANTVDAFGVHLGQDDMDIISARKILGNKIIGRSTHNLEQALEAEKDGADYIGIGPVFHTDTKKDVTPIGLDVLQEIVQDIKIPAFAIGGITLYNIDTVLAAGINRVAVASAILCSNNIKEAVRCWNQSLKMKVSQYQDNQWGKPTVSPALRRAPASRCSAVSPFLCRKHHGLKGKIPFPLKNPLLS